MHDTTFHGTGIEVVAELTRKAIAENSLTTLNQDEYLSRYNALVERYEKAKERQRKGMKPSKQLSPSGKQKLMPLEHLCSRYWSGTRELQNLMTGSGWQASTPS